MKKMALVKFFLARHTTVKSNKTACGLALVQSRLILKVIMPLEYFARSKADQREFWDNHRAQFFPGWDVVSIGEAEIVSMSMKERHEDPTYTQGNGYEAG